VPTYCYTSEDGTVTEERTFSIGKAPRVVRGADGRLLVRDYKAEHPKQRYGDTYPLVSEALGVAESQAKQAEAHSRKIGVPTHFDERGRAIFRSRKHRNDYIKKMKFRDRDAGYGDWAGR
jgi:hypothetical protein